MRDLGSCPEHFSQQHKLDGEHGPNGRYGFYRQFTDQRELADIHHHNPDNNDHDAKQFKEWFSVGLTEHQCNAKRHESERYCHYSKFDGQRWNRHRLFYRRATGRAIQRFRRQR